MAIMMTDLDLETAHWSPPLTDRPQALTIVEFCSVMTRRLGLQAGIVSPDLPEAVPFTLPPILVG